MTTRVITGFLSRPFGGLGLTAGLSIFLTILYSIKKYNQWNKRCSNVTTRDEKSLIGNEVPHLDSPEWIQTGIVKELYYYPLKSGKGKKIIECDFTDFGVSVKSDGFITLKDRMFIVYCGKTGRFQTGRQYSKMVLVNVFPVDENSVRFEAEEMPDLVFNLHEISEKNLSDEVDCTMWWGEPLKCIDCGPQPAAWISKFLTDGEVDLRIGLATSKRRNIFKGPWEKFTKVYITLRNEDTGYFADLASYMLMTETSLEQLNEKLDRAVPSLQFRPNIVVSGCVPFAEDSWEWIKMGEWVIVRNVKPCPRCSMILVDPNTGRSDKHEPLKTLRSFRAQKNPERVGVDGNAPTLGIYCGLYRAGTVKIGDPIYVLSANTNKPLKTQ